MMKIIFRISIFAVVLFIGAYWAASNPTTASSVKNTADSVISFTKDAITD